MPISRPLVKGYHHFSASAFIGVRGVLAKYQEKLLVTWLDKLYPDYARGKEFIIFNHEKVLPEILSSPEVSQEDKVVALAIKRAVELGSWFIDELVEDGQDIQNKLREENVKALLRHVYLCNPKLREKGGSKAPKILNEYLMSLDLDESRQRGLAKFIKKLERFPEAVFDAHEYAFNATSYCNDK